MLVFARPFQPHLAQRPVDFRLVRIALERAAQREHRQIPMAGAGVRHADRNLPLHMIAVESGQQLELLDLVGAPVLDAV